MIRMMAAMLGVAGGLMMMATGMTAGLATFAALRRSVVTVLKVEDLRYFRARRRTEPSPTSVSSTTSAEIFATR